MNFKNNHKETPKNSIQKNSIQKNLIQKNLIKETSFKETSNYILIEKTKFKSSKDNLITTCTSKDKSTDKTNLIDFNLKMNEKNILIDEYIDLNDKHFLKDQDKLNQLENNFGQKCNLTSVDNTDDLEGDDEQTDDEIGQQLNGNGQQANTTNQRRRRKSSGKKLNKTVMQSSLSSNHNTKALGLELNTEDGPMQSSSSSLSSWIHLPDHHLNQVKSNKNLKNLTSSCDTISEEEHRKNKRNLRSIAIDDDIVSSNDDVDSNFFTENLSKNSKLENKLDKKSRQTSIPSCDSLSSSPSNNVSYDSSPIKSTTVNLSKANNKLNNQINQNKENDLFNNIPDKRSQTTTIQQNHHHKPINRINNHQTNSNQHECLNCHNNYITLEQQAIPWLYNIKREEAEKFLHQFIHFDGVFLVRVSTKNSENFVLSFVHEKKVKHCHIRKIETDESTICFSIDQGKTKFYDLKQLVEFYQLNNYFLPCKLKYFLVHK